MAARRPPARRVPRRRAVRVHPASTRNPFAMLVVADLLGVPEADHELFREALRARSAPATSRRPTTSGVIEPAGVPLRAGSRPTSRTAERDPRDDVLTGLATATFPDGSTPEVLDVVRIAAFLFAAGQETTARLLGTRSS